MGVYELLVFIILVAFRYRGNFSWVLISWIHSYCKLTWVWIAWAWGASFFILLGASDVSYKLGVCCLNFSCLRRKFLLVLVCLGVSCYFSYYLFPTKQMIWMRNNQNGGWKWGGFAWESVPIFHIICFLRNKWYELEITKTEGVTEIEIFITLTKYNIHQRR